MDSTESVSAAKKLSKEFEEEQRKTALSLADVRQFISHDTSKTRRELATALRECADILEFQVNFDRNHKNSVSFRNLPEPHTPPSTRVATWTLSAEERQHVWDCAICRKCIPFRRKLQRSFAGERKWYWLSLIPIAIVLIAFFGGLYYLHKR